MTLLSRTRFLASTLVAALAVTGAVALPDLAASAAGDPSRTMAALTGPAVSAGAATAKKKANSHARVRNVKVEWKGAPRERRYHDAVNIPNIGVVELTCKPNRVEISLKAGSRNHETQMWLAKYEDKSYGQAVAVKTVRIYKYANANDNGKGGTSNPQHEGLNQRGGVNGVENFGKGYAYGVISQRPGRNHPAGDAGRDPVTTFNLNWYWNGFDYPAKNRYCKLAGTFMTRDDTRVSVNWHGDSDARGNSFQQIRLKRVGYLNLRCETGRNGSHTLTVIPDNKNTSWYAEIIQGEGRVDQNITVKRRERDPETGKIGPMEFPRNGMVRIFFDNGKTKIPYLLSSYQITNNPRGRLNLCETAMGQLPT